MYRQLRITRHLLTNGPTFRSHLVPALHSSYPAIQKSLSGLIRRGKVIVLPDGRLTVPSHPSAKAFKKAQLDAAVLSRLPAPFRILIPTVAAALALPEKTVRVHVLKMRKELTLVTTPEGQLARAPFTGVSRTSRTAHRPGPRPPVQKTP